MFWIWASTLSVAFERTSLAHLPTLLILGMAGNYRFIPLAQKEMIVTMPHKHLNTQVASATYRICSRGKKW